MYPLPRRRRPVGPITAWPTRPALGEIVAFHPDRSEVVIFDRTGHLTRSWPVVLKEGHGITLVEDDGQERLWLADPGSKMLKNF